MLMSPGKSGALVVAAIFVALIQSCVVFSIRAFPGNGNSCSSLSGRYFEAPDYRNGLGCAVIDRKDSEFMCNPRLVRIAMTLDLDYLRGTVAAVHSILKHASCPENVFFHFIMSGSNSTSSDRLVRILRSTFPSLGFRAYVFDENTVNDLISSSVRQALENPLNYARSYLAEILEPCVKRVIYLDSDVILVDDIQKQWGVTLSRSRVIGAPEYCHANFTRYFTNEFWLDPELSGVFIGKRPCYFNTGVMVVDLERWREGNYTKKIEKWMEIQKQKRIYDLGSLPPFMLVFGGDVEPIKQRWNQHGLGGDNVAGNCRSLHPGPVSLLHWSGKGKPWTRLDMRKPCPVDYLWLPYDLYKSAGHSLGRMIDDERR